MRTSQFQQLVEVGLWPRRVSQQVDSALASSAVQRAIVARDHQAAHRQSKRVTRRSSTAANRKDSTVVTRARYVWQPCVSRSRLSAVIDSATLASVAVSRELFINVGLSLKWIRAFLVVLGCCHQRIWHLVELLYVNMFIGSVVHEFTIVLCTGSFQVVADLGQNNSPFTDHWSDVKTKHPSY